MAPLHDLVNAYDEYIKNDEWLYNIENETEHDRLWNEIWEKQRRLPTYLLQEYFRPASSIHEFLIESPHSGFNSGTAFNGEPIRRCDFADGTSLDLDSMEYGKALHRDFWGASIPFPHFRLCWKLVESNSKGFMQLYWVRTFELKDIIKSLLNPKPVAFPKRIKFLI